jgi:V8-like Glu-specific endopeptidase
MVPLTATERADLRNAAISANLANPFSRQALFANVHPAFVATIPFALAPGDQLQNDLKYLTDAESLADGSVPILQWLNAAADSAFGRPEAKIFHAFHARLSASMPSPHQAVAATPVDAGGLEITIGRSDLLPIEFLEAGRTAAAAVAKILVPRIVDGVAETTLAGNPAMGAGTAWLIADEYVLTNHHVINNRAPGQMAGAADFKSQGLAATVIFGFDFPGATGETFTVASCDASDATLDFALLRLASAPKRKALKVLRKPFAVYPQKPVALNIIQHPDGRPKQIAVRNNLAHDATADTLRYFTDTNEGSSGSPVMTDNWTVVALHRGYQPVENVTFQGAQTAYVNYGTHLARVLDGVQAQQPAAWAAIDAAQAP